MNEENPYQQARQGQVPYDYAKKRRKEAGACEDSPQTSAQQQGIAPSQQERIISMLVYLSCFIAPLLGPLLVYIIKKDSSEFIAHHCREALNLFITSLIVTALAWVTILFLIGFLLVPIVATLIAIAYVILPIVAAIKAFEGKAYRLPFILRIL